MCWIIGLHFSIGTGRTRLNERFRTRTESDICQWIPFLMFISRCELCNTGTLNGNLCSGIKNAVNISCPSDSWSGITSERNDFDRVWFSEIVYPCHTIQVWKDKEEKCNFKDQQEVSFKLKNKRDTPSYKDIFDWVLICSARTQIASETSTSPRLFWLRNIGSPCNNVVWPFIWHSGFVFKVKAILLRAAFTTYGIYWNVHEKVLGRTLWNQLNALYLGDPATTIVHHCVQ